jgi:hypothetical protein
MTNNPSTVSPLGPVIQTFKPRWSSILGAAFLGLLLLAVGAIFVAFAPQMFKKPIGVTFGHVLGAVCVAGCVMFFSMTVRLACAQVDLCERGFRYHSPGGVDEVTWDQVDLIRLHVGESEQVQYFPSLTVLTKQGKTFRFTSDTVSSGSITDFVNVMRQLTSGYANLWDVTSKASRRRRGVAAMVMGLLLVVMGPMMFLDIARAEQTVGGEPLKVHWVAFIIYQLGGKWLVAVVLVLFGVACLAVGSKKLNRTETRD